MFNKSYNIAEAERANKELAHSYTKYSVKLLDDSPETFNMSPEICGHDLLEAVCDCLEIMERDYFGISYMSFDPKSNMNFSKWLQMDKLVRKQLRNESEYRSLSLRVRFVPADASQMQEVYTRYQLFMQIKQDVFTGKLIASKDVVVQLAGCALQSELGDWDQSVLKSGYVGDFRFIPDQSQTFENDVASYHKSLSGFRPEDAEMKFLTISKKISNYGCDNYFCEMMNSKCHFGLNAYGVIVLQTDLKTPFILPWNSVDKILAKGKLFIIQILFGQPVFILTDDGPAHSIQAAKPADVNVIHQQMKSSLKFLFPCNAAAKEAWQSCIETHSFFRVKDPKQIKNMKRSRSLFRMPSSMTTFFSGRRTLPEILDLKRHNRTIERSFHRISSRRYNKRNVTVQDKNTDRGKAANRHSVSSIVQPPVKSKAKETTRESVTAYESSDGSDSADNEPVGVSEVIRGKSIVTQSVRLPKSVTAKPFQNLGPAYKSVPRQKATKSQSFENDDSATDSSNGDLSSKNKTDGNAGKLAPRVTSSIHELKTGKTQTSMNKKHSSSLSSMKNAALQSNPLLNQSTDKLADTDTVMEISMKSQDGRYGFTIKGGSDSVLPVIVTKVNPNSAADLCVPKLCEGDQIIKINNKSADDLTNDEIKEIIRSTGQRKDSLLVLSVKQRLYYAEEAVPANTDLSDDDTSEVSAPDLRSSIKFLEDSFKNGNLISEFENLYKKKQGLAMNEAKKPENSNKNRYRDILPYDQTRVSIRNGEYINANFVNVQIGKTGQTHHYIASQGPMNNTYGDFIQMIWENKVELVVMLTDLEERGRSKCFKYWPASGGTMKTPSGIQITNVAENTQGIHILREISLKKDRETRKFSHLHYSNWPDHDVPSKVDDFVNFLRKMRQIRNPKNDLVLVHCSAGIGRTGVLITTDLVVSYLEMKMPFSLVSIVKDIRNQRAMLIQSQKQYEFVCRAILHYYTNHIRI